MCKELIMIKYKPQSNYLGRSNLRSVVFFVHLVFSIFVYIISQPMLAQAPAITYASPQVYVTNTPITPLIPINTGGQIFFPVEVSTAAGTGIQGSINGAANAASFYNATNMVIDAAGNKYVADYLNHKIRKISSFGIVSDFAGSGTAGANDGTGVAATFNYPGGIAIDATGNLYVADCLNNKIRKISPLAVVTTLAGNGSQGAADGTGTAASFFNPTGLAVDQLGNVYVADCYNNKIRKISSTGVVTTIAGNGSLGTTDGPGGTASFNYPTSVAVDGAGLIFVADYLNHKIRKISTASLVSTFAGSNAPGALNGIGGAASFNKPKGIALDALGNLYVADCENQKIRKITSAGLVSDLAGIGTFGDVDGGISNAMFSSPTGLAVDALSNVYVADYENSKIRKISPSEYSISPNLPAGLSFDTSTGIISGTPTGSTLPITYTITATNAYGSNSTSVIISVCAAASGSPSVTISTISTTVCQGANVLFTAVVTNQGTNAIYQWKKNGINVGINSPNYSDNTLLNNDVISCTMSSIPYCTSTSISVGSSITMIVTTSVPVIAPSSQSFCSSSTVSDLVASGSGLQWYTASSGGLALPLSTNLLSGTYYATQTVGGCESTVRTAVAVSLINVSAPIPVVLQPTCTDPNGTITITSPIGSNLEYGFNGVYQNSPVYASASSNIYAITVRDILTTCTSIPVNVIINQNYITPPVVIPTFTYCQNDTALVLQATASAGAILNWYGTNATGGTASTLAPTPSTTIPGTITYYVSQSNAFCESNRVSITITTLPAITPSFNFDNSFCAGTIQPPLPNSSLNGISGSWSPSIIDNTTSGSYTFVPNPNQCAIPITVDITVHQVTLFQIETFVSDGINDNQTITVLATNTGDYFYQLDQGPLQNENIFENVSPGMHTVVVYDKYGCSDPISDDEVLVINYPLYFTPNEDGFNDRWNIVGLSNLGQFKINIYDRYGKFLKAIESNGQGWDGTFNNKLLPSDDYWFTISYLVNGNNKEIKSHFSLKR